MRWIINAQYIAIDNDKIYCITDGGIFYYNKEDNSINRLSKINGLSDIQAILAAYDEQTKTLLIAYSNTNIDLLINNHIINISDIKRKSITGIKSINNIIFNKGMAYLSCSFGLVVIDINKGEVKDTYKIGENADYVSINQTTFINDSIYVATSKVYMPLQVQIFFLPIINNGLKCKTLIILHLLMQILMLLFLLIILYSHLLTCQKILF